MGVVGQWIGVQYQKYILEMEERLRRQVDYNMELANLIIVKRQRCPKPIKYSSNQYNIQDNQNPYFPLSSPIMKLRKTPSMKLPSNPSKPSFSSSQKSLLESRRKVARTKRIKQKNVIYPLSNPNKIIFITNQYGNGFKKQKLENFDCPAYIPVEEMLREVNETCYHQWKVHHEKLSTVSFEKLERALGVILAFIFIIAIVYFTLIFKCVIDGFSIMNLFISAFVFLIFVLALYVCFSRREKDESLDGQLVEAIQHKLLEFNKAETEAYGGQARFRWTCHKECLWIALNL